MEFSLGDANGMIGAIQRVATQKHTAILACCFVQEALVITLLLSPEVGNHTRMRNKLQVAIVVGHSMNKQIIFVARLYLGIMAIGNLLGILWSYGFIEKTSMFIGMLSAFCSLCVSVFPRGNIKNQPNSVIYLLVSLCLIGTLAQAESFYRYITELDIIQYPAIIFTLGVCLSFLLVIYELLSPHRAD